MARIIGKESLKAYSQELALPSSIRVRDLLQLIGLPDELVEVAIIVRGHQKVDLDDFIDNEDEVYLFMAVMGG